jgi:hypothetical protein
MNNEPVAWKSTLQSKWFLPHEDMEAGTYDKQFWIPLYTQPHPDNLGFALSIIDQQKLRIAELEKDLKYFTNPCDPMCKPSICDCFQARFAINNRKTLTDEEWNKAFDCYCETDEGVLKFDFELRDEWKKEQLIRWKEALRKAQEK